MRIKSGLLRLSIAILVLGTGLSSRAAAEQTFPWQPTLESAKRLAAQTNRLVLIQFTAPWCGMCRLMDQEVFGQPGTAARLDPYYVPVKINVDYFPATARQYGITRLPTTILATADGQPLERYQGKMETSQYLAWATRVASDSRQRLTAQIPGPGATAPGGIPAGAPVMNPAMNPAGPAVGVMAPPVTPATPAANPALPPATPTAAVPGRPMGPVGMAPIGPQAAAGPPASGMTDNRYADYFTRRPETPPGPSMPRGPAMPSAPAGAPMAEIARDPHMADMVSNVPAPVLQPQPPMVQPPPMRPLMPPSGPQNVPPQPAIAGEATLPPPVGPTMQSPVANPPLALDGYCPVRLSEKQQWIPGDRRWGAIHRGRTYLFSGADEQRRFLADPDRYAPMMSGNDPVLALDQGQTVPGHREHGVFFGSRVYLFSSEASLQKFSANPNQYVNQIMQAMRVNATQRSPLPPGLN